MKKLLFLIVFATTAVWFTSCQFDDSEIWSKLDEYGESIQDHEKRIVALEELCQQMNTNISSLSTILEALENRDYITNISPIRQNGKDIGYTITFAYGDTVTIYHGKDGANGQDGKDGADGQDGKDGVNGEDGKDGYTPKIGVVKDTDGIYYWTLDGVWMLDVNGDKIKAVGVDGKDGADGQDGKDGADGANGADGKDGADGADGKDGANGQDGKDGVDGADGKDGADGADGKDGADGADGKDGITPRLKIEEDYWYISYDNGLSWEQLGKATGADGATGSKGERGDSFFLDITQDDEYVYLIFVDGSQISIPRLRPFSLSFSQTGTLEFQEGETIRIDYTLSYGYKETKVQVISDGGWTVKISRTNDTSGVVSISAPIVRSDAEIVLLATDGRGHSTMGVLLCSLTNSGTLLTVVNDVFNVSSEATTIQADIQTNISDYDVVIPDSAKGWIFLEDIVTRTTLRNDVVILKIAENDTNVERRAYISFNNKSLGINKTLLVQQQRGYTDYTITYTSTDGKIVSPYNQNAFGGAKVVNNSYKDGVGKIRFDRAVTEIGMNAYNDCANLQSIVIPDSATTIGEFAFEGCVALCDIVFGSGIQTIESSAFAGCSALLKLDVPHNVTSIESGAFSGCNLVDVTIGNGITSIANNLFSELITLKTVVLGDAVKEIGDKAFYNCTSLRTVVLPNTLTKIRKMSFYQCSNITKLAIPASVTYIGEEAFCGCEKLSNIRIASLVPPTGSLDMFNSISNDAEILVPHNSVDKYRTAPYWNRYVMQIFSEDGIAVPYTTNAIYYTTNDGELVSFDKSAFGTAYSVSNTYENGQGLILFDREITAIGEEAFSYEDNLLSIIIPERVNSIGDKAFYECDALTSVTIPDSVTTIGDRAFQNCSALKEVYCKPTTPPVGGIEMFSEYYNYSYRPIGCQICVPVASVDAYKAASYWCGYKSYIVGCSFAE